MKNYITSIYFTFGILATVGYGDYKAHTNSKLFFLNEIIF